MITPVKLSEYFIKFFNEVGDHISHLKIQKLLYYTDVWHRVYFNAKLFDEKPQAWVHGPVYTSVYQQYRDFGAKNIIIDKSMDDIKSEMSEIFESKKKRNFINDILQFYGNKSAFALEMMTHNEVPWQKTREGYGDIEPCNEEINMKMAKKYYASLLRNA